MISIVCFPTNVYSFFSACRLLAARHKRVRFGAFPLATFGGEFDRAALPVMLVYKNGEVIESFFNLSTTLGQTSFDENDVARLLGAVGVLELDEIGES